MAMKMACDVFDTVRDVRKVEITVKVGEKVVDLEAMLCPRAVDRLMKKIESGTTAPATRNKAQ